MKKPAGWAGRDRGAGGVVLIVVGTVGGYLLLRRHGWVRRAWILATAGICAVCHRRGHAWDDARGQRGRTSVSAWISPS